MDHHLLIGAAPFFVKEQECVLLFIESERVIALHPAGEILRLDFTVRHGGRRTDEEQCN